jgi:hypothetical protein
MFERRHQPLMPRRRFIGRLARSFAMVALIAAVSLLIGTVGYHLSADLPWIDAFLNASMILTGMGPVDRMETHSAKLFAAIYALYGGIAFLSMSAVILAPIAHRLIHRFHLEDETESDDEPPHAPRKRSTHAK